MGSDKQAAADVFIAHVDMDAFFARVEKMDDPELRGQPVIVGGLGSRGVVSTACYRAREFDVHSAMPMETARERCPRAEFLSPRTDRYREISNQVRNVFASITPAWKPLSLDEAYLDVTGVLHHYGSREDLAETIREKINVATGLTASVGVGPNKMIAKLASDYRKPDGYHVVGHDETEDFVGPLRIEDLPGIGPNTLETMKEKGVGRVADLQDMDPSELTREFGQRGLVYHRKAKGEGTSELVLDEEQKSISNEETYPEDVTDENELIDRLGHLTTKVARRLREKELEARTIFIKERRGDFTTFTRQRSLAEHISSTESIWEWVERIFEEDVDVDSRGIRLQGVGVKNLRSRNVQADLFDDDTENRRDDLNHLVDDINEQLGDGSVIRGRDLDTDS